MRFTTLPFRSLSLLQHFGVWGLLGLCLLSFPGSGWSAHGQGQGGAHRLNWSQLNLTAEQHKTFLDAEGEWRKTYGQVQPELLRTNGQLRSLMRQPDASEADIARLQQKSHTLEDQLRRKATECFIKKKKALSPEQRQKMMQLMNTSDTVDP